MKVRSRVFTTCALVLAVQFSAMAAVMIDESSRPIEERGWPDGVLALVNLKSRFATFEGEGPSGETHVAFRGGTEALQKAIDTFAAIRAPELEISVVEGPNLGPVKNLDWEFVAISPRDFYRQYHNPLKPYYQVFNEYYIGKPVPAPSLIVYTSPRINWDGIKVPRNVHVTDHRAVASPNPVAEGTVLDGTVYDMGTGKTISGALIELRKVENRDAANAELSAKTQDGGKFRFTSIPPSGYFVDTKADGYAPRREFSPLMKERAYQNLNVYLAKATSISGKVVDAEGNVAAGAKVWTVAIRALDGNPYSFDSRFNAAVNPDGTFELTGLPEGYATLGCIGGWTSDLSKNSFESPSQGVVIVARRNGAIRGTVLGADGKPAQGDLSVDLESTAADKTGTSGGGAPVKDGKFNIDDVVTGPYVLKIMERSGEYGYKAISAPQPIESKPGETAEIEIKVN